MRKGLPLNRSSTYLPCRQTRHWSRRLRPRAPATPFLTTTCAHISTTIHSIAGRQAFRFSRVVAALRPRPGNRAPSSTTPLRLPGNPASATAGRAFASVAKQRKAVTALRLAVPADAALHARRCPFTPRTASITMSALRRRAGRPSRTTKTAATSSTKLPAISPSSTHITTACGGRSRECRPLCGDASEIPRHDRHGIRCGVLHLL